MHTSFRDIYLEADLPVLSQTSEQSCISVLGGINLISFYDCFIGYSTRSVTYDVISDHLSSTRCLKGYVLIRHVLHVQKEIIYYTCVSVSCTYVSCPTNDELFYTCFIYKCFMCSR